MLLSVSNGGACLLGDQLDGGVGFCFCESNKPGLFGLVLIVHLDYSESYSFLSLLIHSSSLLRYLCHRLTSLSP